MLGRDRLRAGLVAALVAMVAGGVVAGESVAQEATRGDRLSAAERESLDRARTESQAREQERERRRALPAERAARERSRSAYRDQGDREGQMTARERLGVGRRRWERPEGIVKRLDEAVAVVQREDGQRGVALSSVPLWTKDAMGRTVPVDLSVRARGQGFGPVASVVDTQIAQRVGGGVSLDDVLGFAPVVEDDGAQGEAFGDKVYYSNVDPGADTDFMVAVLPQGAEALWILRSPRAAEEQALDLEVPRGGAVELDEASGDVVVRRGGEVVARIAAPSAVDSDGTVLDARYRLEGRRLVVEAPHRELDVKYPIELDPVAMVYGSGPNGNPGGFVGWNAYDYNCGSIAFSNVNSNPQYVQFAPGGLTAGCFGRWRYHAPGSAYAFEMDLAGMSHFTQGGTLAWYGIMNANGSSAGGGVYFNGNDPPVGAQPAVEGYRQNVARRVCTTSYDNNGALCPSSTGNAGNIAFFGLYNAESKYYSQHTTALVYGTTVYLADRTPPSTPSFTAIPASGWVKPGSSIGVSSSQGGLGVLSMTVDFPIGGYNNRFFPSTCNRSYTAPYRPCPPSASTTITVPQLPEASQGAGKTLAAHASTYDRNSTTASRTVGIDGTPPSVAFSGSAYDRRASMPGGRYDLRVTAIDGNTSSPSARRSGATRIRAVLNGQSTILDESQSCATDSCQMARDVPIDAGRLLPGANHVDVTAYDAVGNQRTERFAFTVSCCAGPALDWVLGLLANQDIVFGDVDGDGAADLVARNQQTGEVTVRPSDGEESFGQPTVWGVWPVDRSIALADYDGDGTEDLMGYVASTGALSTGASQGDSFAAPTAIGTGPTGRRALFADLDLTDTADVLLYDPSSGALSSMVRAGETLAGPVDEGNLPPNHLVRAADVDRNGSGDIVAIPTEAGGNVVARLLQTDGLTAAQPWASVPANIEADLGDGDGDGRADLLLRRVGERVVDIRLSTGTSFGDPQAFGEIEATRRLASGDVSGDLTDDLIGVAEDGTAVSVAVSLAERLVEAAGVYEPDPTLSYDDGTDTDTEPGSGGQQFGALQEPERPPGCKYGELAQPPTDETMALGFSDDGLTDEDPARQGALQRMREAGTTWGRIVVKWDKWEQESGYRDKILNSARDYRACGFRVLATLTGGQTNDNYTNSPNRDAYANFVEDAVVALDAFGVRDFSLWNEPNLAEWLKSPCSDGRTLASTADRYRVLYDAGYDAARNATRAGTEDPIAGLRIYLGELSELPASGRLPGLDSQGRRFRPQQVKTECGSGGELRQSLKTTEFLAAVVRARPEPLRTSGVAWHPYQHRAEPDKRTYAKPENRGPTTGGVIGIGYAEDMQNRIERLFRERSGNGDGPALSTAASRGPALYMTEFGYFSQPFPIRRREEKTDIPSLRRWQAWQAESTRAEWLPRAYAHARENGARLMLHWQLDETGRLITDQVDARLAFDTGLLGVGDVALGQPLPAGSLQAHGNRSYGKDPSVGNSRAERRWSSGTTFEPARTAFCALRKWASDNKYEPITVSAAQHAADPAVLNPVVCP